VPQIIRQHYILSTLYFFDELTLPTSCLHLC